MPYHFSKNSLMHLDTCHPLLKGLATEVIRHYDFSITCGWRNEEDQNKAFAENKSSKRWPDSKHNYMIEMPTFGDKTSMAPMSLAFDFIPYPPDEGETHRARYALLAGFMIAYAYSRGFRVVWGGDWNSNGEVHDEKLEDLGHIELVSVNG